MREALEMRQHWSRSTFIRTHGDAHTWNSTFNSPRNDQNGSPTFCLDEHPTRGKRWGFRRSTSRHCTHICPHPRPAGSKLGRRPSCRRAFPRITQSGRRTVLEVHHPLRRPPVQTSTQIRLFPSAPSWTQRASSQSSTWASGGFQMSSSVKWRRKSVTEAMGNDGEKGLGRRGTWMESWPERPGPEPVDTIESEPRTRGQRAPTMGERREGGRGGRS